MVKMWYTYPDISWESENEVYLSSVEPILVVFTQK